MWFDSDGLFDRGCKSRGERVVVVWFPVEVVVLPDVEVWAWLRVERRSVAGPGVGSTEAERVAGFKWDDLAVVEA